MSKQEIYAALKNLAQSQGRYGRLLEFLEEYDELNDFLQRLEDQNIKDVVELVLILEC